MNDSHSRRSAPISRFVHQSHEKRLVCEATIATLARQHRIRRVDAETALGILRRPAIKVAAGGEPSTPREEAHRRTRTEYLQYRN